MSTKPTCGPMYKSALEKYCGGDPQKIHLFAAGFVSGEAEKVYLGACSAAMFRPSQDRMGMLSEIVEDVCQRYGLVSFDGGRGELWICRNMDVWEALREMHAMVPANSEEWHRRRAELCGIPLGEVDVNFHERAGHGERCD